MPRPGKSRPQLDTHVKTFLSCATAGAANAAPATAAVPRPAFVIKSRRFIFPPTKFI